MQGSVRIYGLLIGLLSIAGSLMVSLGPAPRHALAAPQQQVSATPDPCAPATLTPSSNIVNVRAWPGPDYQLLERLREGEVRQVIGRHGWYQWWQIETAGGALGWVWDSAVTVSGDILSVPIVDEGVIPEDVSAPWQPTPHAPCLATPAPAAVAVLSTPIPPSGTAVADLNANDDGWSAPINLSRSGLASEPQLVVDSNGTPHVLSREEGVDGFLYTRQTDESWLEPVVVELPFGTDRYVSSTQAGGRTPLFTPLLVADGAGLIHAFWTDDQGLLRYSQVEAEEFERFEGWSVPVTLAEGAAGTVAAVDGSNGIHIAYVRAAGLAATPPGVYYQRSTDGGGTWDEPALLYSTRYLGAVPAELARGQIAAAGSTRNPHILVAWEIPLLEQLFMTASGDGGASWGSARLIDSRQPGDLGDAVGPSRILLAAQDEQILLLWQAGHAGTSCQQYYQHSTDGGLTWGAASVLQDGLASCATGQQLLMGEGSNAWLLSTVDNRSYLLAWDGERWSEPQEQETLSTFTNAATFRPVTLGCLRAAINGAQELIALGCDTAGSDIWTTTRLVGSTSSWFEESEWTSPVLLGTGTTCPDSLQLVAGLGASLHAFWLQQPADQEEGAIYYSGWDGQRWTPAARLFEPMSAKISEITAVTTRENQLFVFWVEKDGKIYYSETDPESSELIVSAGLWSTAQRLSLPHDSVGAPAVVVDGAGNLLLAYAVPLNEGRGIYLTTSTDRGRSWNEPLSAFDGAAAGWQIVGSPRLALSTRGTLEILWSQQQLGLNGSVETLGLHSTQLRNQDTVFDDPKTVTAGGAVWYEVGSDRAGFLHQFWQEDSAEGMLLWHRQSEDDGRTWSIPTIPSSSAGIASVATGRAYQLHLLLLPNGREALQQWTWTEEGVTRGDGPRIASTMGACSAAAAVSEAGQLVLGYGALQTTSQPGGATYALYALGREADVGTAEEGPDVPAAVLAIQPVTTPQPSPLAESIDEASTAPTNGPEESAALTSPPAQAASNPGRILLFSLLPVGLVILALLSIWRLRRLRLTRPS